MMKNEKGNAYINWVIAILVILILAAITIKVLCGETGLIQQWKEEKARNSLENNIVIELKDSNN